MKFHITQWRPHRESVLLWNPRDLSCHHASLPPSLLSIFFAQTQQSQRTVKLFKSKNIFSPYSEQTNESYPIPFRQQRCCVVSLNFNFRRPTLLACSSVLYSPARGFWGSVIVMTDSKKERCLKRNCGDNLGKTQARISHKMALWRIFGSKRGGVRVGGSIV